MKPSRSFPARRALTALFTSGLAFLPALASAHPGHYHPPGEDDEFDALTAGFIHPLTGIDHLLLTIAAGALAFSWKSGKARTPIAAFLGSMAIGAFAGRGMQGGLMLEIAIALTVIAAGAAFLFLKNLRTGLLTSGLAAAGFIHGFAHGSEVAGNASFLAYAGGFLASSALLTACGAMVARVVSNAAQPALVPRLAGCALLAIGAVFLIQAL